MPALNLDTDALLIDRRVADPATPIIACLCAQWCGSCREYQTAFDQVADAHPEWCFVWIDIETHADRMEDFDIDNFPTIVIEEAGQTRFYGPVLPHVGVLQRMLAQLPTLKSTTPAPGLRHRLTA